MDGRSKGKGNPEWKKGKSANPKGRPKSGEAFGDILVAYLAKKATKEGYEHWLERVVELAWSDPKMMSAVMKKVMPDKVAADIQGKIEVSWIGEGGNPV